MQRPCRKCKQFVPLLKWKIKYFDYICSSCHSALTRKYYVENLEKCREYKRKYNAKPETREKTRKYTRIRYQTNPKVRAAVAAFQKLNNQTEKRKQYMRDYMVEHRKTHKAVKIDGKFKWILRENVSG